MLCEKPFCSNYKESLVIQEEYNKCSDLTLVEAFHFRYHPLTLKLKKVIDEELGSIKEIRIKNILPRYISKRYFDDNDIRFDYNLSGGILMDFGCYAVNALRYFGGNVKSIIYAKPTILKEDIETGMEVKCELENGGIGYLDIDFRDTKQWLPDLLSVDIRGKFGKLYCNSLLSPNLYSYITKTIKNKTVTIKEYGNGESTYYYQLKAFLDEINGENKCPTGITDSVDNMRVIDMIYKKANMKIRKSMIIS